MDARLPPATGDPGGQVDDGLARTGGGDVLVEAADGVVTVTLHRPRSLNALTKAMIEELQAVLEAIGADPVARVVVLTGAGRGFCAGGDLHDQDRDPGDQLPEDAVIGARSLMRVVEQLRGLDLPVIAAVNGPCAGAGLAWACGCDIRVAGRSATFHTAFAKAGLTGDHGISWTLPRVVGAGRAMAMLLLDEPVDAEQALAWGLVTEVVDDDALLARARAIAGQLAGRSRLGLAGLKANLLDSQTAALGPSLDTEADRLIAAMRAPESAALARRFLGRDA